MCERVIIVCVIPAVARVLWLNEPNITREIPFAMKPNSLLQSTLAAALLASTLLAANVGEAQPAPKPAAQRNSPYLLEIQDGWLLQSKGDKREATLENVVELLRELELSRSGAPANIVLSPDLPKIKIANLKLASTTLTQELEALRVASGERFVWSSGTGPQPTNPSTGLPYNVDPTTGLPFNPSGSPGAEAKDQTPLYILRPAPEAEHRPLLVEAFSLAGYFESRRESSSEDEYKKMVAEEVAQIERIVAETKDIYMATRSELKGREASRVSGLTLQFHRGANLLVVIGEPEAVEVATKVIGALPHVHRSGGSAGGMGGDPFSGGNDFRARYGIPPQPATGTPGAPPGLR
jgi:hypothetical protein